MWSIISQCLESETSKYYTEKEKLRQPKIFLEGSGGGKVEKVI